MPAISAADELTKGKFWFLSFFTKKPVLTEKSPCAQEFPNFLWPCLNYWLLMALQKKERLFCMTSNSLKQTLSSHHNLINTLSINVVDLAAPIRPKKEADLWYCRHMAVKLSKKILHVFLGRNRFEWFSCPSYLIYSNYWIFGTEGYLNFWWTES